MSIYLDLETDRYYDEEECRDRVEWMTVKLDRTYISIGREYTIHDGSRRVDCDAGISFSTKHLDPVIDALVRLRADAKDPTR